MGRIFITGFGPFEGFPQNPSERLVRGLGEYCAEVLPVSFRGVDAFLDRGLPKGHDRLLMLGVCGSGRLLRLERIARNKVGRRPDIEGEVRGPGRIRPQSPETANASLFAGLPRRGGGWRSAYDAGSYLCNYLFYEACRRLEGARCGFIHVPPFSGMQEEEQAQTLLAIMDLLERNSKT